MDIMMDSFFYAEVNTTLSSNHLLVHAQSLNHVRLFETPWTVAYQSPLTMGFSKQEYWSGLPVSTRGSSQPRNRTLVSCIGRRIPYHCATWEALMQIYCSKK